MYLLAAALLGAIAGSFLNALSYRLGVRSIMRGRSQCMRCGHTLSAFDLVPVFSYVFLRGRCRYCGTRISAQYPLVECTAAGLGAAVAWQTPEPLSFAFWFVVWTVLLFVLVYDVKHFVIPWSCSGVLAALGIAHVLVVGGGVWAWAAGPLVAAPLLALSLVSRGRWMGWGDGSMMVGVGWLLGLGQGFTGLLLAFWIGAAVGIVLMLAQRGYTMKSELPFAPFLIVGAAVAYFLHVDLFYTIPALFF